MSLPDTHLDLGCGAVPRNPYHRARLCGVDIRAVPAQGDIEVRVANVALEPIPWADNSFASVSAFDFLEHVPRVLSSVDGRTTNFPFVRLMDEVWRVLADGGRLWALTPAFPNEESFRDPTHVNIITERTHEYFCGDKPLARMYGFNGSFKALRTGWVRLETAFDATADVRPQQTWAKRLPLHRLLARFVRDTIRRLRGRPMTAGARNEDRLMYFLWEFEAVKTAR